MAENTPIVKTFTYDIADAYLHQTSSLKRTAQWTYKGPRYLWTFVDMSTNKIMSKFHYTERDNGADVPTPPGQIKVMIDAAIHPEIACCIHNEINYRDLPQTTEVLPDGSTYGHSNPIPPDHTYELTEIQYNSTTGQFVKPYPWKKAHMDWETLKTVRNNMLTATDQKIAAATDTEKAEWETYRQKLRDLPRIFAGVDPWKVPFPPEPFAKPIPTQQSAE
jgi:hypothetical protein